MWLDADGVRSQGELEQSGSWPTKAAKGIDGFSFQEINLWKSTKQYRTASSGARLYVRLWRVQPTAQIWNQEGLHGQQYPDGLAVIQKSTLRYCITAFLRLS